MTGTLQGATILITGAASGLGRAATEAALAQGANIVAVDLDTSGLKRLADDVPSDRILCFPLDITDEKAVENAVADAVGHYGSIDGCLNNAGIGAPLMAIVDLEVTDFDRVMRINARGSFTVLKHVLRHMKHQGHGAVVNTGSILGNRGVVNYAAYCASKAAVHAITKVAALEVAEYGVRVNAIAPGLIDTPMNDAFHTAVSPADPSQARRMLEGRIPLRRYATAREVAEAALMLLSDSARYVTGEILDVDGGLSTSF